MLPSRLFRLVNSIQRWDIWPVGIRFRLLRLAGVRFGGFCNIMSGCDFVPGPIAIGAGTFINRQCLIDGSGGITLGAKVFLAPRVNLMTITHTIGAPDQRAATPRAQAPITIGDGAWIGAAATVLPGVIIGAGAVVGAAALVNRSIGANMLAQGVPAKPVRALDA